MKKITIITMQLKNPGGIERFVSTLATMFAKDYAVEIIANYGRPSDQLAFPLPSNVTLTFLSPTQPAEISMKRLITSFKWHRIPGELIRRFHITRERQKNLTHVLKNLTTNYLITERALYNSLVNKFYRGKAVKIATDHNYLPNDKKYIQNLTHSLKNYTYLIVATPELQKLYQNRIGTTKCLCIPNPLPSIPRQKSPLKSQNLLAVGRFVPEKDFTTLIEVMAKVHARSPAAHLTIIGDGPEMPKVKSRIKELNLTKTVDLPGALPQSTIADYYYNSSLFVMTSTTEAFGLVLTEAMSYGLPCVALSRASGARAQITTDTGVLCSTPKDLATAIVDLLQNRPQLLTFQKNINSQIQKYSTDSIYTQWQQILNA